MLSCPFVFHAVQAEAAEINISGNGSETVNEAVVDNASSEQLNQNNDAQIDNNSSNNSDTGANTSNNSTGETNITTGDASQNITLSNSANVSAVNQDCCPESAGGTSINISNNGSGSNSNALVENSDNQTINSNNEAIVYNNINSSAATGNNTIKSNTGPSMIRTGDVNSKIYLENENLNQSYINNRKVEENNGYIKISGNGAFSKNTVKLDNKTKSILSGENKTVIRNYINTDLSTGNNNVSENSGLIAIITGSIFSDIKSGNSLNKNIFVLDCCIAKAEASEKAPENGQKKEEAPSQQPATTPASASISNSVSTGNSAGSSGPSDSSGQVAGITARHLPITGNNWLFFSLLGNIIMLFLGAYLRLRSGNGPPAYVYA